MQAFLFACLPLTPFDFDERTLPPITFHDLARFHDARLAIGHGATYQAIGRLITHAESRWWDQAGQQHEYDLYVAYLYWARQCWEKLQDVDSGRYSETLRLQWLRTLRSLIGPECYYAGRMPDYPWEALRFIEGSPPKVSPVLD